MNIKPLTPKSLVLNKRIDNPIRVVKTVPAVVEKKKFIPRNFKAK